MVCENSVLSSNRIINFKSSLILYYVVRENNNAPFKDFAKNVCKRYELTVSTSIISYQLNIHEHKC